MTTLIDIILVVICSIPTLIEVALLALSTLIISVILADIIIELWNK